MSRIAIRLGLAAAAMLATGAANAASFNCAKAKTPDEKAICASRALSELDVKMATLFGVRMKLPMLMGARGAAQDEQHQFLIDRGTCGADKACIGTVYQQRIDTLNLELDDAMHDYCIKVGICG
ncbi:MAG TPA: hypothetical protein VHA70_05750 [Bauldia sp.]|nr:hypothetical protein [Bauldia sp.]